MMKLPVRGGNSGKHVRCKSLLETNCCPSFDESLDSLKTTVSLVLVEGFSDLEYACFLETFTGIRHISIAAITELIRSSHTSRGALSDGFDPF